MSAIAMDLEVEAGLTLFEPGSLIEQAAKRHALAEFPREAVGVVLHDQYVPLRNDAADPERSFVVNNPPADAVAVIHSHTRSQSPAPSAADMLGQQASAVPWGIFVCDGLRCGPLEWFGDQAPTTPYLGRSFLSGVRDCWGLIRDIYRQELGITLLNLPRDDDWFRQGIDLLSLNNIHAAGFEVIDADQVQPGDVALGMVASRIVNHCGLYVGRGLVLHHMMDRLSSREPIRPWQKSIRYFVRHELIASGKVKWEFTL